jgi:hypothetical protein
MSCSGGRTLAGVNEVAGSSFRAPIATPQIACGGAAESGYSPIAVR